MGCPNNVCTHKFVFPSLFFMHRNEMIRTLRLRSNQHILCFRRSFSVNPNEIQKFSRIGKEWWNSNSATGAGPLHYMNPVRVTFIRSQLAMLQNREKHHELEQLKGLKILDAGCGGGLLSEALARLGAIVTSIDPSETNIAVAREHAACDPITSTINYINTTVEEMARSEEKFDAVCSLEVLEHVDNPPSFLAACSACLAPHGSIFLSTMNRTQKSRFLTITMAEHVLKMIPAGTHDWHKYITPSEMRTYLEGAGCDVVSMQGMVPDIDLMTLAWECSPSAVVKRWRLSEKDWDVNYIVHAVRKIQD